MLSNTHKLGYVLLIALSIASAWLVNLNGLEDDRVALVPHSPDFFSTGYVKWETDETGRSQKKITADRLEHYASDGVSRLEKPQINLVGHASTAWSIRSETGVLSEDGKNLQLHGRTLIERGHPGQQGALKITTSNLTVKPQESRAESSEKTEITSAIQVTTGAGMKIHFAGPVKLQLLGNVKGIYGKK